MAKIRFLVKPGAKKNAIGRNPDGSLWIMIAAPAEGGKANTEIQRFLAQQLKLPGSYIQISSGKSSRLKILEITGEEEDLLRQLELIIG